MLITFGNRPGQRRRGVILIVVLAMLTLFTILGISFVLVADAQAVSSRIAREAENETKPRLDGEAALAYALGQLLYDVNDNDPAAAYSAARSWSLGRSIYGWNPAGLNDRPFTGNGRVPAVLAGFADPTMPGYNDDAYLVNYAGSGRAAPVNPGTAYTYPDHHNFFLAEIDPRTGQIIAPSFHRDYLFGNLGDVTNVNWNNTIGRFLTGRPRTRDNQATFPYPVDRYGDVKNLDGAPGGCDSIWMDLGAPVMTAPDGRRYKMLVAPLILQLDGRLNLNVIGNLMGYYQSNAQDHRSNQGWGPWETSPKYVLNANGTEWRRLFLGNDEANAGTARVRGRYDYGSGGTRGVAPKSGSLGGGNKTRPWGQVDYNAMREAGNKGDSSQPLEFPGTTGQAPHWFAFPYYQPTTYGSGVGENAEHPQIYRTLTAPELPNRHLPLSGLAQLLRYGGSGSEMLPSDLTRLLSGNFVGTTAAHVRRRNQVTLLSTDLDRSTLGLSRTSLNRSMPDYPAVNGDGTTSDAAATATAVAARQGHAQELFEAIRNTLGYDTPQNVFNNNGANSPEYQALRQAAQVAVNLVDYVDVDDFITPFAWSNASGAAEYVYGVELPRLVINESYVQYDNSAADEAGGMIPANGSYNVNVWVELMNPVPNAGGTGGAADLTARLTIPAGTPYAAYRIVLANENAPATISQPANTSGDPGATALPAPQQPQTDWGATPVTQNVLPFDPANRFNCPDGGNVGFYVIGPEDKAFTVANKANLPVTHKSPHMTYAVDAKVAPLAAAVRPTIVLQRLANPSLPPNTTLGAPNYNPYVTVDYVSRTAAQAANDARIYDFAGKINPAVEVPLANRVAFGRNQPFDGENVRLLAQQAAPANQPLHTFYRQNSKEADPKVIAMNGYVDPTLKMPFDWLVHLDRALVNPLEAWHVSGFKPADLTQKFVGPMGATTANNQAVPWRAPGSNYYKAFDRLCVEPRGSGLGEGGRRAGRVNLNGIWTQEMFLSLADPQPGNGFDTPAVNAASKAFLDQRTPGWSATPPFLSPTDPNLMALSKMTTLDRPIKSFSSALDDTLLRDNAGKTASILDVSGGASNNPYLQKELIRKIYNGSTTRGNAFAIWVTVGFFEVDAQNRLGAEMNKAENRHVRHRSFAIVDRTQMSLWPESAQLRLAKAVTVTDSQGTVDNLDLTAAATIPNPNTGRNWVAQTGAVLVVEPNTPNEETIVLGPEGLPKVYATRFRRSHPAGALVIARGNPGPWVRYDPRKDADVVPYFAAID